MSYYRIIRSKEELKEVFEDSTRYLIDLVINKETYDEVNKDFKFTKEIWEQKQPLSKLIVRDEYVTQTFEGDILYGRQN